MTRALPTGIKPSRRWRCARRVLSLCTALAAVAFAAGPAPAIGPGLVSTTGADAGERLNVDGTNPFTMFPGTYDVANFTYNSTGLGEVIPFLATGNGNEYQLLWIGSRLAFGVPGETISVDPIGHFTLRSPGPFNVVFAGFYTTNGGRVAFIDGGNTDHNATVVAPRGGVPIGNFSNPNLARTYAFSIRPGLSTQTYVGPGFLSNSGADAGARLNIAQANARTFAPGNYDVTDFSFNGNVVPNMPSPGSVTPFLARLTADNTYETVWVGGGVPASLGGASVDPDGGFTLHATETLYAGFATTGNAAVAFTEGLGMPPGFGLTDHDNSFTVPTGAGQVIGGFSNPDLARQYSFSIGVVPEPGTAALGAFAGLLLLSGRARRRYAGAWR